LAGRVDETKESANGATMETGMMWILMMVIGLAAFAAMFGFTWACDRL
jgi:hypothetical protein